jgi:serine/threonine protein kinase
VLSLLGAGGMGEVYRARDARLNRDVAIKILPDSVARDEVSRLRFEREAQAVAALSHPNVLAIFDTDPRTTASTSSPSSSVRRYEATAPGTMPVRKAVEWAAAVAHGRRRRTRSRSSIAI